MALDPGLNIVTTTEAKSFVESCPIGNGRLGAMVFGGVTHERVVLNESTMWSGSPQDADRPDAYKVLPEIRRLLLDDENRKAQDLLQKTFVCKGPGGNGPAYGCYQTFGDLTIETPSAGPSGYKRVLDLDTAIARIEYTDGGTTFRREALVSAPAQVIAYHFTAGRKGQISFTANLSRKERATTIVDGADLILEGKLDSGNPEIPGVRFAGRLRAILSGGRAKVDDRGIHVEGADEATLLFSAATNMFDKAYAERVKERIDSAPPYDRLKRDHIHDYQSFFHRVSLKLPEGPSAPKPTLDRLIA